jgi:hypothetical protein
VLKNDLARTAIAIAAAVAVGPEVDVLGIGNAFAASAAAGFTGGVIAGRSLEAGFIGAVTASAFYGVGDLTGHFDGRYFEIGSNRAMDPDTYFLSGYHLANIAGHALVGCAAGEIAGGSCGPQAFAAGAGAFAAPVTAGEGIAVGTTVSAVVGGAAAELGGGKFANGAITAAYGYLFNDVALACRATDVGVGTHCGLFVFQGNDPRTAALDAQFSLGFDKTEFNTAPDTMEGDLAAFRSGNIYRVAPPPGVSSADFDQAVIDSADRYRAPNYRLGGQTGPNSNSAAAFPIIESGAQLPQVQPAPGSRGVGALGLDYWLKHPYLGN